MKHEKLVGSSFESNTGLWVTGPVCEPLHHHDSNSKSLFFFPQGVQFTDMCVGFLKC